MPKMNSTVTATDTKIERDFDAIPEVGIVPEALVVARADPDRVAVRDGHVPGMEAEPEGIEQRVDGGQQQKCNRRRKEERRADLVAAMALLEHRRRSVPVRRLCDFWCDCGHSCFIVCECGADLSRISGYITLGRNPGLPKRNPSGVENCLWAGFVPSPIVILSNAKNLSHQGHPQPSHRPSPALWFAPLLALSIRWGPRAHERDSSLRSE